MSGMMYRPDEEDGGDVVACAPSSRNIEDWWTQSPDQILWLGEELFYRIQSEAGSVCCKILPTIEHFS
jgi:hypothetical protein